MPVEPYRPRRIQPLGVVERAGRAIKVIGITAGADLPADAEVAAAIGVAERESPPGVGFCIVHRGAEALWVLVCWWEVDIMYERLWRQAWIDHVLTSPSAPDFAGYLAAALTVAGSAS